MSYGKLVDPDVDHRIDPATETAGGNFIQDQNVNLHHEWDDMAVTPFIRVRFS